MRSDEFMLDRDDRKNSKYYMNRFGDLYMRKGLSVKYWKRIKITRFGYALKTGNIRWF